MTRAWRYRMAIAGTALAIALLSAWGVHSSGWWTAPAVRARHPDLAVIDAHVHVSRESVPRALEIMDRYGIDHVVNLSGGRPSGGLPGQLEAARSAGGRMTVFAKLEYGAARKPGYGTRMADELRKAHALGARGLKIIKRLGLELRGPDGQLIPIDAPDLDPVFETAGELNMPVAIHTGDPRAFWLPVDDHHERAAELRAHPDWVLHGKDVPGFGELLDQLERRIARHPDTIFISVHFGNCAEDPERVARMLRAYPNMFIDTAARIPEIGRHPARQIRAFFIEFQNRILYGSDLGVRGGPLWLGSRGAHAPTAAEQELFFGASRRYFETPDRGFAHPTPIQGDWLIDGIDLPRAVLKKIYADNAARVLGLKLPGHGAGH